MQSRIVEGYRDKRIRQLHLRHEKAATIERASLWVLALPIILPVSHAEFSRSSSNDGGLARYLAGPYHPSVALTLKDMSTWTELIGHAQLRSLLDDDGHFWLEQNATKKTKWAKLARDGHDVAWEFAGRGGSYTGRMLIDGELYTPSEATKKFLKREG